MKDYVLSKFTKDDMKILNDKKEKIIEIIENFPICNFDKLMNKYNKND